jgi:hypothetical protein
MNAHTGDGIPHPELHDLNGVHTGTNEGKKIGKKDVELTNNHIHYTLPCLF